jgi:hypothetical protein
MTWSLSCASCSPGALIRFSWRWGKEAAPVGGAGRQVIYVAEEANRIQYSRVQTGPLQDEGVHAIDKELKRLTR